MEPGKYYHVYNRSVNRELLFKNRENFLFFLKRYGAYTNETIDTYSYCLMPTHFHLFIRIKEDISEAKVNKSFKDFFISYSKAFNKANNRHGSLFQNRFKKKLIDNDAYYSAIIAYLHFNPVRAGLVSHPRQWEFSSYNATVSDLPTQVQRSEVLNWFGGRKQFIDFHNIFSSNGDPYKKAFEELKIS